MDISEFASIAKTVLTDKRVIGTAVVVFLCMDFGAFVANYTKKPAKIRRPRTKVKPARAAEANSGGMESPSDGTAENTQNDSSPRSGTGAVSEK